MVDYWSRPKIRLNQLPMREVELAGVAGGLGAAVAVRTGVPFEKANIRSTILAKGARSLVEACNAAARQVAGMALRASSQVPAAAFS